jgi:hypothetical protein
MNDVWDTDERDAVQRLSAKFWANYKHGCRPLWKDLFLLVKYARASDSYALETIATLPFFNAT